MKLHKQSELIQFPKLCKNCLHKMEGDDVLVPFTKDEWLCKASRNIDLLDGEISFRTCRKTRNDAQSCTPEGKWYKPKP